MTPDPVCLDCGVDPVAIGESYVVADEVWALSGLEPDGGELCIGCLEARLGRRLVPDDFQERLPLNLLPTMSARMQERLGRDAPPTEAEVQALYAAARPDVVAYLTRLHEGYPLADTALAGPVSWDRAWAESVSDLVYDAPEIWSHLPREVLEHVADWLLHDRDCAWDRVIELEEESGDG